MSESTRPLPGPEAAAPPSECDVCHEPLGPESEYRSMQIVSDATPRRLRESRGGGFLEEEWNLIVCAPCDELFRLWLFREPEASEAETERPPPLDAAARDSEPPSDEMAPLAEPAPNHS